jgi:hypothetical protein
LLAWELRAALLLESDGARSIGRFDLMFLFLEVEKRAPGEQIPFYSIVIGIFFLFAASY